MTKDELIGAVQDYLEFRNQFESRAAYWGMASSQRPALFYKLFDSLDESAKNDLAHIMVATAMGEVAELRTWMLIMLHLISGLCLRGRCDYFVSESEVLEREFHDPLNVECWLEAEDLKDIPRGLESKKDWHYGLSLKNVLELIEPASIHPTYEYLMDNAKSRQFRRALLMSTEALKGPPSNP